MSNDLAVLPRVIARVNAGALLAVFLLLAEAVNFPTQCLGQDILIAGNGRITGGRINENAPAHEGSARAEGLMSSIVNWLAATFDLPAIREAPRIEFIQPASMAQLRYRGSAGNQGMPLDMGRDIVAVYDDAKRTIYLPQGWAGVTPADQSLLVHEMVHHLQNLGNLKYACPEAREKLAFAAQEQWLELFDRTLASEFDIDPLTLLVRTNCFG